MRAFLKFLITLLLICNNINAQTYSLSGKVTDTNNRPLYGANVILSNTLLGSSTDQNGEFVFNDLPNGNYIINVSMIGFENYKSNKIILTDKSVSIDVKLKSTSYLAEQIIVTAGKHRQNLSELPVSASIISAEKLSKKNYTTFDKALRYVPGVTMTLDQVSIRGSSGYSRGAGSRVLVAFDGIPMYTGDSGEIIWEVIPSYEIERVEIIKGAASALYGSSAIGGVVNIISKSVSSNPVTFVKTYYGVYDKPSFSEWDWSGELRPLNGFSISHSRKFNNLGVSGSFYRFEDFSYRQNDYDKRIGGYLKLNYDISKNSRVNLWGTGYNRNRETFNFWKDINNTLSPPDDDLGDVQPSNRQIFGASYEQVISDQLHFSLKPSLYRTFWEDETVSNNRSESYLYRSELKVDYEADSAKYLVTGIEFQNGTTESNIFGNNSSIVLGVFSQLEYKFQMPVIATFGIRYDYSKLEGLNSESSFSPKIGLNYKISDSIILRGSAGTGFRAPTLAEAFTSTSASGIVVKPNPNIKSENSLSFEVGSSINLSSKINLDFALFHNEYYDLIEPSIDPLDATVVFDNVTRARIQGVEISSSIDVFPRFVSLNIGYNYLWARDIEQEKALKYRHRHTAIASLDINYGVFNAGTDFRFASRAEQIDFELVDFGLVPNGDERADIKILDLRAGINLFSYNFPGRLFFNANNVLNYNYVEMIGNVSPIRNYSVSLELLF